MASTNELILEDEKSLDLLETNSRVNPDNTIKVILLICAAVAVVFVFFIIFYLFLVGGPFFFTYPLNDFLFGEIWYPHLDYYGALPIIVGTLLVTLGAMVIAIPLGLACAIFIAEVAPPKTKRVLKFTVEILAGIPSVVYGYWGIVVFNNFLVSIPGISNGYTWLSGSFILAIMALPTIVSISEDALDSVPFHYKEASLGLGATKWQTISKVDVPAAMSGITASIILGIGRAVGETMAVIMVAGNNSHIPGYITNMLTGVRTITATIGLELGEATGLHVEALFALAIVLFFIVLIINTIANTILNRMKKKFEGTPPKKRFQKLKASNPGLKVSSIFNYIKKHLMLIGLLVVAILAVIFLPIVNFLILCILIGLVFFIDFILTKFISKRNQQKVPSQSSDLGIDQEETSKKKRFFTQKYSYLLVTLSLLLFYDYYFWYYTERIIPLEISVQLPLIWIQSAIAVLVLSVYFILMKTKFITALMITFFAWILTTWIPLRVDEILPVSGGAGDIQLGFLITMGIIVGLSVLRYTFKRLNTDRQQTTWYVIIYVCGAAVLFILAFLIGYIIYHGIPMLITPGFITDFPSDGGIYPAIIGTLYLMLGAILFAVPIGIFAGIFLSEYAKGGPLIKIIRAGIDNLNGTPSIVFGLFGYLFFVLYLQFGISLLAGMITLALMILPTIIRTTEEAVKAIPQSFREGSLALGASKWQSIYKVVLPSAIPGVITGIILAMGRAAGETAPIIFTAVVYSMNSLPQSLFDPTMALTFHLYILMTAASGGEAQAAGTALMLLIIVIALYSVAFAIRLYYQRKKKW